MATSRGIQKRQISIGPQGLASTTQRKRQWDPEAADFNWTAGACIDYATETPVGMNCPPPKTGCAAHVEQDDCNDDSSCKWCQAWTQGWPSCKDVRFTEKELQSTCDKPDASGEGEGEGLSGTCG